MKGHKFFNRLAVSLLIAGLSLTNIPANATAEQLYNNDAIDGEISRSSPNYRFRNMWSPNTPVEELRGEEYTFNAEEGDEIDVNLDIERGGFSPVLVLFHAETNKQMAYSQNNSFTYRIPRSGEYKLLVLAKNNPRNGRYTLEISGLDDRYNETRDRWDDRADRHRDNREYDRQNNRRDNRRDNRQNNRRDNRQNNRQNNISSDRQQFLEDEFGLRPLDCRLRRTMVIVNFRENGDNYTLCAEPTRSIPAGTYDYNYRTRNLDAKTPEEFKEQCRVSVGGMCISR
ncbi:hypothetical protein BCD67_09660 [Oscillatoriales cyanobacterium USR001]|nr:hypothetical protein BCD67_09660 [Oscillatoriales cyanobacterium USR001]